MLSWYDTRQQNITDFKHQLSTAVIANLYLIYAMHSPCGTFVQTVKSNKLINNSLKTIVEQQNSLFYCKW